MIRTVSKIIVVSLTVSFVAGLVIGGFADIASAQDKIKVGVSLPTQREERWVKDAESLKAEAAKQGLELSFQVSDNDAAKQISQCENLIAQQVKVLIVAPHDANGAAAIVEKAREAGIKVISYDRLILNADVDLYISFDNVKVGEIQGEYITKLVPRGNYIVLAGSPTDNNARMFKEGAMKFIKPLADSGEVKIVMEQFVKDWQPAEAMKLVENSLTANGNKIDAILAPNDGTAGGAIQALAAQKLDGKVPVTGQDAELSGAQRIVEGTQTMTVFKDTRLLAVAAIEAAVKMARGENVSANSKINNGKADIPSMLLTPVGVDRGNIDKLLVESGYLKKEDVYKNVKK